MRPDNLVVAERRARQEESGPNEGAYAPAASQSSRERSRLA